MKLIKRNIKSLLILFCLIIILIFTQEFKSRKSNIKSAFNMGMIYWKNENSSDIEIKKAIKVTLENSDILTAQIPWNPYNNNFINDIKWIYDLSKSTNKKLIINVDWMNSDRNSLNGGNNWSFSDKLVKEKFIRTIVKLSEKYKPDYINLGIEINYLALEMPDEFKFFLDIYNYSKPLIQSISTKSKIGVTFQLELLAGADKKRTNKSSYEIIRTFGDNIDYIGISMYPNIDNKDYLSHLKNIEALTSKNISIFETSLPTNKYSVNDQSKYLDDLLNYIHAEPKYDLLIWTSTHDICDSTNNWQYNLGLLNCELNSKKSFYTWIKWFK